MSVVIGSGLIGQRVKEPASRFNSLVQNVEEAPTIRREPRTISRSTNPKEVKKAIEHYEEDYKMAIEFIEKYGVENLAEETGEPEHRIKTIRSEMESAVDNYIPEAKDKVREY